MHHVITFDILFLVLAWEHLKRYKVKLKSYPLFIAIVLTFSVFVSSTNRSGNIRGYFILPALGFSLACRNCSDTFTLSLPEFSFLQCL